MAFALFLVLLATGFSMHLNQAQDFPGRCSCPNSIKFLKGNISDFQVLEKRPACDQTELIITVNRPGNATEEVCVNPLGRLAKAFFRCWERINKDEKRKMECIERKRRAE
ncbi:uncharacterized protein LOC144077698 [Stigmatopora argus]